MAIKGTDQITIADLTDAYGVTLTCESHNFPGTTNAAKTGSVTTQVIAMRGAEQRPASVVLSEITAPAGVTVTKDTDTTAPTLTVAVTGAVTGGGVVKIPVHVDDVVIQKDFTFAIAFTGETGATGAQGGKGDPGTSATSVICGNEAVSLSCSLGGLVLRATTITIPFAGYVGTTRAACTAAYSTLPSGMTLVSNVAATDAADGALTFSVAANANLGGASLFNGEITLTFTCNGQTFTKALTWSKAMTGATGRPGSKGDQGDPGEDAITLVVTSSNGTIFKNSAIETTLTAHVYQAGAEVTGNALTALGTIRWYKDGGTTAVASGATLNINAGDVTNKAVYEARLEA